MYEAGLYVVATPIGNLQDITRRALDLLSAADLVAAEDTRRTRILLQHYGLRAQLVAVHEHNESAQCNGLVERIRAGQVVALVSDAGTPLISDPGYRLVGAVAAAGLPVIPVPGPSAVTAALSVAGLPTDRFVFEGFLPSREEGRRRRLGELAGEIRTLVFYESSHRVQACLEDMKEQLGPARRAVLCRELTKQFETVLRGSLSELAGYVAADPDQSRGEFVLIVAGSDQPADQARALQLARELMDFLPASQAARIAARLTGVSRRELYAAIADSKGDAGLQS